MHATEFCFCFALLCIALLCFVRGTKLGRPAEPGQGGFPGEPRRVPRGTTPGNFATQLTNSIDQSKSPFRQNLIVSNHGRVQNHTMFICVSRDSFSILPFWVPGQGPSPQSGGGGSGLGQDPADALGPGPGSLAPKYENHLKKTCMNMEKR